MGYWSSGHFKSAFMAVIVCSNQSVGNEIRVLSPVVIMSRKADLGDRVTMLWERSGGHVFNYLGIDCKLDTSIPLHLS